MSHQAGWRPAGDRVEVEAIAARQPLILFLSRIHWKKGLDRLIPALVETPVGHLAIVGNDEEGYLPELQRLAAAHGVAEQDHVSPPVGEWGRQGASVRGGEGIRAAVLSENFGNVVLEAVWLGVARRWAPSAPEVGAAEVVRASGGGVVAEGDPEDIGAGAWCVDRESAAAGDRATGPVPCVDALHLEWRRRADGNGLPGPALHPPTGYYFPASEGDMNTAIPVTVIIFTLNEEIHLPSCLAALDWCGDIIVVDSSTPTAPRRSAGSMASASSIGSKASAPSVTGRWITPSPDIHGF